MLSVHPQVADLLYDEERRGLEELEKTVQEADYGKGEARVSPGAV
jgi:copper chaperone CopZ